MSQALIEWQSLVNALNGRAPIIGTIGVRDPEFPCDEFDGKGYDGLGKCPSDGHYMCKECSHLSADAPRFNQDRADRGDRLRLFWARHRT